MLNCLEKMLPTVQELIKRREWLKAEITRIKDIAWKYKPTIIIEEHLKEKRQELSRLNVSGLEWRLDAINILIVKYRAMSLGKPRRGRVGTSSIRSCIVEMASEKMEP